MGSYTNYSQAQPQPPRTPSAREARKRRAALITQVPETDPLACSKRGAEMQIIAFVERDQDEVIEELLRH
jgi:hypothetical protein